jgi:hypothetical protein
VDGTVIPGAGSAVVVDGAPDEGFAPAAVGIVVPGVAVPAVIDEQALVTVTASSTAASARRWVFRYRT